MSGPLIVVAYHREAARPADELYLPVQVGRANASEVLDMAGDDDGVNISARNPSYCELTALYWARHNLEANALGLAHYRRYFAGGGTPGLRRGVMSGAEAAADLQRFDMVVARRRHYVIETVESHYRNAHVPEDLEVLREAVASVSPTWSGALEDVLSGRSLSLFNMFLARRSVADEYADWLFETLQHAEAQISLAGRSAYQARVCGFLGERLLNVFVAANPALAARTRPVINLDGENRLRKASGMVQRKVLGALR